MNKWILHIEGGVVLAFTIYFYSEQQFSWLLFLILLLAPDLAALAYLVNKKFGAVCYNIAHTYALPGLLLFLSIIFEQSILLLISFIWIAHIGMDRLFGFNLKELP